VPPRKQLDTETESTSKFHTRIYTSTQIVLDRKNRKFLEDYSKSKGIMYGKLFLRFNKKSWFNKQNLNRSEIVTVNRIRSDHYNLAYSLHQKNIVQYQYCCCGEGKKDINHVIFYCPLYRGKAGTLIKYLKSKFPTSPISIFHMLVTPHAKLCRFLTSFLKSCNSQI
jgi:hypothetical protein